MKIAVNAQFLNKPNTGMGQYLINLLFVLLKIDRENEYWLYSEDDIKLNFSDFRPKIKFRLTKVPFYKRDDLIRKIIWEKIIFPRAVKKDKADVVWSPYLSASEFKGVKHVITVHDVIYRVLPRYITNSRWKTYYNLAEKAARRADKIITVSECSKKDIIKFFGIGEEKIEKVYLGSPHAGAGLYPAPHSSAYIFYIGGFDYRKNVDGLIKAFKIFTQSYNKDIRLMIAGKVPDSSNPLVPDVKRLVKDLSIEELVKFIGYVENKDLPYLYQKAAMFVFPTLYEGFGLPVLEAMSCGTPVISSNNSSIPEVAGDAALLVDPQNPEEIAKAMNKILRDNSLRQDMIEKGLKNVKRFSWEKCARETLGVFKTL